MEEISEIDGEEIEEEEIGHEVGGDDVVEWGEDMVWGSAA